MKKLLFVFTLCILSTSMVWAQPWTYDFGTGTGDHTSGVSTEFLPNPTSGTARVRVGSGGGSFNLENPGLSSLGSGSELRIVAPTSTSANKFSIYDYSAGKTFFIKFDILLGNSTGGNTASSGEFYFFQGDGAQYNDNNAFANAQVFTGIQWKFGSSGAITTNYRNSKSWFALGTTPFSQGNIYTVEIYGNNTTSSADYYRQGTSYSVASNKQDIWVNGSLIGNDCAKAQLADDSNIDSFLFYGISSTSNVANCFLDDITYSNTLPTSGGGTPTITVNPATLTGFSYVQGSGPSSEKTFTISGSNLTANISIDAPTEYEISKTSGGSFSAVDPLVLTQSGGSVSATTIYVRLKAGLSAGNYNNENITASSTGATNKTVTCSGTVSSPPPPNAPTANAATSVSYNKFTANWNSVSGATKYYLDVYTKGAGATDLIISEYVEGSSSNKAIELYNGTGSSIDLSNYSLKKQTNGAGNFGDELTLSGTLANGDTYVIVSNAGTTNLAGNSYVDLATNSQALSFNGNDAVALYKNGTQIDVVGVVNQTTNWGEDVTLVRNSSVISPTTTYNTEQWTSYTKDTFTYLGSHTMDSGNSYVSGYQNKDVGSVTSYEVSGLEADKTYYYVVRAYNKYGTSANSNKISVTTNATLPVELSAFTANINSQGGITLMWVTQSETGVNGFYVNRAMVNDLAIAERISPLIPGSNTSHQQVYVYSDKEVYEPGTYYYWLEIQDIDGVVNYYGSRSVTFGGNGNNGTPDIPLVTGIRSIYPNPFNPSATIMYELEQPANLNIEIYNNRGQMVRSFAMGQKEQGRYKLLWDGTDNSGYSCGTGMYFIKMQAGKETFVKKAALVK